MSTTRPTRLQRAGHDDDSPAHYLIGARRAARAHHPDPNAPDTPICRAELQHTNTDWTPVDLTAYDGPICQWCTPDPHTYDSLYIQLRHASPDALNTEAVQ
ncbi:hypothetical protein [Halobaculum magnesiiphilum]|uniref:Uncharacterized protein n=1 Tax=Halobaculum magnesiiphilum TaxID=1017351 RepID=A0A8T8WIF9_9EURY|nr:hypothetical protein [Halobaculum magnesiiphilum]QZP39514.1 hypothetical protein K6T50_18230 [Halobaculum magnesiiphilum]